MERSADALRAVRDMGELVGASVDLDAVLALARSAPPLSGPAWSAAEEVTPVAGRPRIALASGAAFSFSYAENAELLAAAGAEVVPFDPLHDAALPSSVAGLVIGGGFPEMYVSELSANATLRASIAELAASGAPVSAECAGLLYLGRELDGAPMCGVLDTTARMTERLTLGYREAVALGDSILAPVGTRVRGHEFHRTACDPGAGDQPAWAWRGPTGPRTEGFAGGSVHASYLHLHWAGAPQLAERLVSAAAAFAPR